MERHLFRRRRPAITPSRDSRRPTRPRGSARIPIGRWRRREADRFEPAFLAAIDRAHGLRAGRAAAERRGVEQHCSARRCRRVEDAPTQRLACSRRRRAPRLGGASRERASFRATPPRAEHGGDRLASLWIVDRRDRGRGRCWRFQPEIRGAVWPRSIGTAGLPSPADPRRAAIAARCRRPPHSRTCSGDASATTRRRRRPDAAEGDHRAGAAAAADARAALERADEAARRRARDGGRGANRGGAGRPAGPRARGAPVVRSGGASYVGQVADGKRQGLGVADLANGEHQAGDWQADQLNGLGTVRLADDTRYAGQWRDGQSTGLGVREKPGVERAEGNFVMGRLEGLGRASHAGRAQLSSNPANSAPMSWRGRASRHVGDGERYEGGFRGGRRQRLRPGDGGGRQGARPAAGKTESASNQRLERDGMEVAARRLQPMHAPP